MYWIAIAVQENYFLKMIIQLFFLNECLQVMYVGCIQ